MLAMARDVNMKLQAELGKPGRRTDRTCSASPAIAASRFRSSSSRS